MYETPELPYIDFRHHVGTLLLTTQDPDATRLIFTLVLNQAIALNKTSFWVETELKFEGMIYGADRDDFLRLALDETARSHGGQLSDAVLDEFNERSVRFAQPTP